MGDVMCMQSQCMHTLHTVHKIMPPNWSDSVCVCVSACLVALRVNGTYNVQSVLFAC